MNVFTWLKKSLCNLFKCPPAAPMIPVPVIDEIGLVGYAEIPVKSPLPETYDLIDPSPKKLEGAGYPSTRRYHLHHFHWRGRMMDAYIDQQADPDKLRDAVRRAIEKCERRETP